jgi:hypothetical protein
MKLLIVAFSFSLAASVLGDVEVRPSGLKVDYVYKPGNKQFNKNQLLEKFLKLD